MNQQYMKAVIEKNGVFGLQYGYNSRIALD